MTPDIISGQDAADLGPDVTVRSCAEDGTPHPRSPERSAGVGHFLGDAVGADDGCYLVVANPRHEPSAGGWLDSDVQIAAAAARDLGPTA